MAKKTTLADIANILKSKKTKGDTSFWGVVNSVITDNQGNTTGYNVSLDGTATGAVKCNKVVGAEVGDQVLVTLRTNGEAVVIATKGGDADVKTVADDLAENYSTTEEVEEMIEEHGGGSYQIVEWARSSSNSTAPTSGWSTTMPALTTTYKYLWQRIVTVTGETRTVTTQPQVATTLNGLYVFMNNVATDNYTSIDGGTINISNAIYSGSHYSLLSRNDGAYLGQDGISYAKNGYVTIITNPEIPGTDTAIGYGILNQEPDDWWWWFNVSSDGTVSIEGTLYGNGINCSSLTARGTVSCGTLSCSGEAYFSNRIFGENNRNLINNSANSGQVHVGNSTDKMYLYGIDSGTTSYSYLRISGNHVYYTTSGSSRRYKHDIKLVEDAELNPEALYDVDVVQFVYNDDFETDPWRKGKTMVGIIAEDIDEKFPVGAVYNDEGGVENWDERYLLPAMLKLIQDQHTEIEQLKQRVERLEAK